MFSKLKSRKAPVSLSSVSNAIKSSKVNGLSPDHLNAKDIGLEVERVTGLPKNSVLAIAYDPVQSLFAVATKEDEVKVYGQQTVEVTFEFKAASHIQEIRFVKGVYLVCILKTGGITVLSLHSKTILGTYSPPGTLTAVESDPSLDYLILGLANGSIVFYDVDRLTLAPLRVDNLQKKILPKHKLSPILNIEWHPRDIGSILVTYTHCAVLYSLTLGEIKNAFVYQLTRDCRGFEYSLKHCTGGKRKIFGSHKEVNPPLSEAHFHPNGLHVVTVHEDNTLAFWDAIDGTLLEARTLFATNLHLQGPPLEVPGNAHPIRQVRWVCAQDPEITQLVVCGGDQNDTNVVYTLDLGITLKYSITSHAKQGEFYSNGRVARRETVNLNENDTDEQEFLAKALPISFEGSPYFAGNHNPNLLLLLSNLGSLYVIPYSVVGGNQGDVSNIIFPFSVASIEPPITYSEVESVKRVLWFNITTARSASNMSTGHRFLVNGGAVASHLKSVRPIGKNEDYRNVMVTGHEHGMIRLRDVTRGEVQDLDSCIQIDLHDIVYDYGNSANISVTNVSVGYDSREMIASLACGDVVILKYGKNSPNPLADPPGDYHDCPVQHSNGNAKLYYIKSRISRVSATTGSFLPVSLLKLDASEQISCIKMSNVGFAAIAYASGRLVVCDISRGPAVIYNTDSIKEHLPSLDSTNNCHITTMEFAIMEIGEEGFSSILLLCGTNCGGNLVTFRIIPRQQGGFEVVFANKTMHLNYKVLSKDGSEDTKIDQIIPINSKDGSSAVATMDMFQKLGQGVLIPGMVVIASNRDIRVLSLPKNKLAHKVVEDACLKCGVVRVNNEGVVLATLVRSGFIKLSSLPSLGDIADLKLSKDLYKKIKPNLESEISRLSDVLSNGEIFIRLSPTESLHVVTHQGSSKSKSKESSTDLLFNENAIIPPRPVAGTLQWAKGQATLISTEDLSRLVSGPNRRPAKHPESQLAHNISPEANPNQSYGFNNYQDAASSSQKDYKEPVRRAGTGGSYGINSKGFMRSIQTGIESIEEGVNNYANDMSETMGETVSSSKQSLYTSALKSKFGF
ncbi:Piso0_001032 [Millerozyma farinosa CBS 7064]|uniref:Piso0_001032 protein n=1 Tax=Pichia sorbitophila (strain ATCC MYA-4447 / BCRC 22081 / CBS 7064 / NBRC 10061 / NRRL Y-12695) TaxID=559304 RepID=G8YQR0_PICSO|nr:Piso0_001032 [Millerozyma farinosa CBS 7064]CCE78995.1 Piso0_001032 [Millerozyma farinosa CBS 7064]